MKVAALAWRWPL